MLVTCIKPPDLCRRYVMFTWLTACYVDRRDVVEQALPVLVGQQWSKLQHHSLADKLQVSMLAAMPLHHGMPVKM